MIDDAIAVRFPKWLIIWRSFTDFFLLEIWYFSMWPISWAITPINDSGLFMYLSKPVVKYIVFFSFIKALGRSSSITENLMFVLFRLVINKRSEMKLSISWSYIVTAFTFEKKK